MTLLNRAIATLFNGVSQQPPALRAPSQSEAIENGYVTVAEGVRKRPPTQHVSFHTVSAPDNIKAHLVFRSATERYVVLVSGGTIRVLDTSTGAEATVDTTTFSGVASYLTCTNAIESIEMYTVGDTTFIVNREKTVAMAASGLSNPTPTLYVYVKEGRSEATYYIDFPGVGTATFTASSASASYSTLNVAEQLRVAVAALGGGTTFTATRFGSLLTIRRVDNAAFTFSASDSQGANMLSGFLNRVERYSDLPRYFTDGATVEVRGAAEGNRTGYWVKFRADSANSSGGYWEETVAPVAGEPTDLDATTMPVALVRLGASSFRLERPAWATRLVGSTATTAKPPSFVGDRFSSIFFWRDRLGFLAGEGVLLSRAADIFNFWPRSSVLVNDDDPIDVTVSAPKVSILRHAVPFQRNLMLFSESAQFQLTADGALSPKTVRVDVATEYDCSSLAKPVSAGRDVYFQFQRASPSGGSFGGVREYYIDANAVSNAASDVTAHVPSYLPDDVHRLSVSSTEDLLLALTRTAFNEVYCYKFLWDGDKKVQSAWFRWSFQASDKILAAEMSGSSVYFVIQRVDGICLERMDLSYTAVDAGIGGEQDFLVLLDRRISATGSFNSVLNETSWTLPYGALEGSYEAVTPAAWGVKRAQRLPLTKPGGSVVKAAGDWSTHPVVIGVQYTHQLRFSEIFMRDREDVAISGGRLQLRYFRVKYRDSGYFRGAVTTPGRDPAEYVWSPMRIGNVSFLVDAPQIGTGTFAFPVASRSDGAIIEIINDSPFPSCLYGAEWEGVYTNRAKRL